MHSIVEYSFKHKQANITIDMSAKAKQDKNNRKGKKVPLVILIIVLVAAIALGIYIAQSPTSNIFNANPFKQSVTCEKSLKQSDTYVVSGKYKDAKNTLDQANEQCVNDDSQTVQLKYHARQAVTTFLVGDKKSAKTQAEKSITIYDSMSEFDRQSIVNYQTMMIDVNNVQRNSYSGSGILN